MGVTVVFFAEKIIYLQNVSLGDKGKGIIELYDSCLIGI